MGLASCGSHFLTPLLTCSHALCGGTLRSLRAKDSRCVPFPTRVGLGFTNWLLHICLGLPSSAVCHEGPASRRSAGLRKSSGLLEQPWAEPTGATLVRRSKRLWPVGFGGVCHTALTSRQPTEGPWELQTLNVNFCEHRFLVSEKWPPAPCGPGVTAYGPRREPGLHGRLPVSGDFKKKSFGKSRVQRKGPERPLRTAQDQAPPGMDLKPLPVT